LSNSQGSDMRQMIYLLLFICCLGAGSSLAEDKVLNAAGGGFSANRDSRRNSPGDTKMEKVVTVLVAAHIVSELQTGNSGLSDLVRGFGATIEPLHPGSLDTELRRFFIFRISEPCELDNIIHRLMQYPGVEAAYVKPPGELP